MTKMPRTVPLESEEQCALVEWLDLWAVEIPAFGIYHSIPNGGKRPARTAAQMKLEGQRPGVPDLFFPEACRGYHGLYVEMKSLNGSLRKNQKIVIPKLVERGYCVCVCKGAEVAKVDICWYLGVPSRLKNRMLVSTSQPVFVSL